MANGLHVQAPADSGQSQASHSQRANMSYIGLSTETSCSTSYSAHHTAIGTRLRRVSHDRQPLNLDRMVHSMCGVVIRSQETLQSVIIAALMIDRSCSDRAGRWGSITRRLT